jgi:hypothetical protein
MALPNRDNSTNYEHPQETNLLNLHKSMQYNSNGEPVIRTHVDGITLEGNVLIDKVRIEVDTAHNTLSELHPAPIYGNVIVSSGNITSNANITGGNVNVNVKSFGNIPITGSNLPVSIVGNANVAGNVGIIGNVNVTQGTNPWTITGNANIAFGETNTDAFGRLRVSNGYTLFDNGFRYGDHTDIWSTKLTATGNAVYDANAHVVSMTVAANGDEAIRETRQVFQYQPGKSLLIFNTFCMTGPKTGLRQRVGYFGASNGVFLETDGTTVSFVIRKDITGSVSDSERAAQADWSRDTLLGPGNPKCPSGITLDLSKPQIFWIDVEWLGVGSVRCGFVIDGVFYLCHTFHHANTGSITGPYMSTACLPLRYEIAATGATTGTLNHVCNTVISEGGYEPRGQFNAAGMGVTTKTLTTSGTYYPLVSIRLNSSRLDAIVRLAQLQAIVVTNTNVPKNCHFKIVKNATLTGASWVNHSSGSVDYDLSATTYSGGTEILQGYFSASSRILLGEVTDFNFQLGRDLLGTSDIITVMASGDANNIDVAAELSWFNLT